jgi:hypothetical protein
LTPDNDVVSRTSKSDDVAARLCISRLPLLTPPCNGSTDRNEEDWLHRLVATSAALGVFPDGAAQETVDHLAVDTAASAIVARLVMLRQRQRQVRRPVKLSLLLPLTTTQICMSLLLRWIVEQCPRLGILVNLAAYRLAVLTSQSTHPYAAAYLPLLPVAAFGDAANGATDRGAALLKRFKIDAVMRAMHQPLVDSMAVYAKTVAALA